MQNTLNDLLTNQLANFANQSQPAKAVKRTNQHQENYTRTKYRPNPLNYALINTYKLFIVFNDGTARTFIAPVFKTTYNAYKSRVVYNPNFIPEFDYLGAFTDFETRIKIKYNGQYKLASIYEIKNDVSREIVRFERGKQVPAAHQFDGVLFADAEICFKRLEIAVNLYASNKGQ